MALPPSLCGANQDKVTSLPTPYSTISPWGTPGVSAGKRKYVLLQGMSDRCYVVLVAHRMSNRCYVVLAAHRMSDMCHIVLVAYRMSDRCYVYTT